MLNNFIILGGRRGQVTLGHILKFATGSEDEPVLGFTITPTVTFCPVDIKDGLHQPVILVSII